MSSFEPRTSRMHSLTPATGHLAMFLENGLIVFRELASFAIYEDGYCNTKGAFVHGSSSVFTGIVWMEKYGYFPVDAKDGDGSYLGTKTPNESFTTAIFRLGHEELIEEEDLLADPSDESLMRNGIIVIT